MDRHIQATVLVYNECLYSLLVAGISYVLVHITIKSIPIEVIVEENLVQNIYTLVS